MFPRNEIVSRSAVIRPIRQRKALNGERQSESAFERQATRRRQPLHTRHCSHALSHLYSDLRHADRLRKSRPGRRHVHRQHVVRQNPGSTPRNAANVRISSAAPSQQDQRQRRLRNHQHRTRLVLPQPGSQTRSALAQRHVQICFRRANTEISPNSSPGKFKTASVNASTRHPWIRSPSTLRFAGCFPDSREQRVHAEVSEHQPEHAAGQRKQHALRAQLPDDAAASGPERGANCDFAATNRRARAPPIR